MSVLHKTMATGLIALTCAGASLATATTADARRTVTHRSISCLSLALQRGKRKT